MAGVRKFKVGDRVIKNLFCSAEDSEGHTLTGGGFLPACGTVGTVRSTGLGGTSGAWRENYVVAWDNTEVRGSNRWSYNVAYLDHVISGEF